MGTAGGKKKRRVEIHPFHPELERKLEELRVAVAKGWSFLFSFILLIHCLLDVR